MKCSANSTIWPEIKLVQTSVSFDLAGISKKVSENVNLCGFAGQRKEVRREKSLLSVVLNCYLIILVRFGVHKNIMAVASGFSAISLISLSWALCVFQYMLAESLLF